MRWQLAVAALPLMSAPMMSSGAIAADIKGTSKIDQVTVFPSGAEVTRLAKVKIDPGEHVLLFTDLPARALPGSIRVEGKANARLAIASVDTRRTFVPRDDAATAASERKRIEDAIEKLGDERAQLQASIDAAEAQKEFIASLSKPAQPAAGAAPAQPPDYEKLLTFIGMRHAEAQKTILETQLKVREVDRQIKDLQGKLAALAPRQDERTEVKIFVNAGAALDADLTIRYQVGNASWTPYYDARLVTGSKTQGPKLGFERRASIQQRTGEAWDEVQLSLSTTRPGSSTAAPEINTQTIDYVPDTPPPPPPRPTAAPMAPPMAQRAAGTTPGNAKLGAGLDGERARSEVAAAEEVRTSIDAQGYQAVYGIPSRVSVPTTGEAKRVQIDATELDPALVVRTVPKRDTTAFLYAKATLSKGTPVLPGMVSLFRDGTFVGTGQLPLLPSGEEHELGFGADDAVRVKYAIVEDKRGESGLISSSKTDARSWRITVKNLHERAIPVTVLDQIPVSQNQDVKVELTGKTAPSKRDVEDKRGVLAWDLDLKPDEEKAVEFGYRATWPAAKRVQYGG